MRADAVQAAIAKGRDYAAALGGTLRSVEHIADAGLLGGGNVAVRVYRRPGDGASGQPGR